MNFGNYPPEYNPKVHGPYNPATYYGKPDTSFGEVKLGDLGNWLVKRNKTPQAIMGACSRAFWRWQHKYVLPKRSGMAPFMQVACGGMIFFYYLNYKRMKAHRHYEYH